MPRYSLHPAGPGLEIFEAPPPERAIDWEERVERRAYWRQVRAMVRAVRVEAARIAAKAAAANSTISAPTAPATPIGRVIAAKAHLHRDSFEAPAPDVATTEGREAATAEILRSYLAQVPPSDDEDMIQVLEAEWLAGLPDEAWRHIHVASDDEEQERWVDVLPSAPPPAPAPIPEPTPEPLALEWSDVVSSQDLPAPDQGTKPARYPSHPTDGPKKQVGECMTVGCFAAVKPVVGRGGALSFPSFCWLHSNPSVLPPRNSTGPSASASAARRSVPPTKPSHPARPSARPQPPGSGSGRKATP